MTPFYENNNINDNLQQLSRLIYEQYFLQYSFISNNVELIDSKELGRKIPKGWMCERIKDLTQTLLGGTPSTEIESYWNGPINWLNSGEVANFPVVESELKITEEGMNNSATKLLAKGTTIVSITGNIRCSISAIDTCANQSVVGIVSTHKLHTSYIHQVLIDLLNKYTRASTGNCQQHINKKTIDDSYILVPPQEYLDSYYSKIDSIYNKYYEIGLENKNLTKLRNELLPLLMNGQVTIA